MSPNGAAGRLRDRPALVVVGSLLVVAETVAAFLGAAVVQRFGPSDPTLVRFVLAVALGLGAAVLVRPPGLAVLYRGCRPDTDIGLRDLPGVVRAGAPRLLAGGVVGHLAALGLLGLAVLLVAPFALGATVGFAWLVDFSLRNVGGTLTEGAVGLFAFAVLGGGYALAFLPVSFADLLVRERGVTLDGVLRAPLRSLRALAARRRAGARYLATRGGLLLLASALWPVAAASWLAAGEFPAAAPLPAPVSYGLGGLLVLALGACRALTAAVHVDTFDRVVLPATRTSSAAADRAVRVVAVAALVALLVTAPIVGVVAARYDEPVENEYQATPYSEGSPPFPVTPGAQTGEITAVFANGTEVVAYRTRVARADGRTLRRTAFLSFTRSPTVRLAVSDGPLLYEVVRARTPAAYEREREELAAEAPPWQAADDERRAVYTLRWGDTGPGIESPTFAGRFAYRRVGNTTYRGIPAVEYRARSWVLPRTTGAWPGTGRLVVSRETGTVLRMNVTAQRERARLRYDFRFRRVDEPDDRTARRVVRAVRRNVTVDTPLYVPVYDADEAATALQSGRVVGVSFHLDADEVDRGATIPAGSRVVAVGADGTNYTTTLDEPVTPVPDDRPMRFDLAFALGADGSLERRAVDDLPPSPAAGGPAIDRLVVRDPDSDWTYVNGSVLNATVRSVAVRQRSTDDGRRYATLEPARVPAGNVRLAVTRADTGERVYEERFPLRERARLQWVDIRSLRVRFGERVPVAPDAERPVDREYVVRVYTPRGLLTERTVTLTRPAPRTPTAG